MRFNRFWIGCCVMASLARPMTGIAEDRVQFNRDIRPILSDNCFACHGPDKSNRKAELRLDLREEAVARKAIVAGQPAQSGLIERIVSDDAEERMPPPASRKTLTARQQELLKRWIAEGAEYQPHWAFVPPVRAEPPRIHDSRFPSRNSIDSFIQSRLAQEGLTPSPEATRESLIRRVTLDLTGLPPTPAEVDAFLGDASEAAYEKVVDRLLASPHYGERMAVDWLDAARYADSNGYQVDRDRELWPWRDWVIRSFNDNLPFDQFTIEQLAGDLLPEATLSQRIATGFHRNHMLNEEGGIIPEEFLAEYTADRVETTAVVWLGQTFNCARCHDHKFDPFTQREFYALKAFFHNVPEKGIGNYGSPIRQNAPPFAKLPAPEIEAKIAALNAQNKMLNDALDALTKQASAGLNEWVVRAASESGVMWKPVELLAARGGAQVPRIDATTKTAEIGPKIERSQAITIQAQLPPGRFTALRLEIAATANAASLQWGEMKLTRKQQPAKLRAAAAGDSLAAADLAKVIDGNPQTSAAVSMKPERAAQAVFELDPAWDAVTPTDIEIELVLESGAEPSAWRVFASDAEAELLVPADVLVLAKKEPEKRQPAETKQLTDFRLARQAEPRRLTAELEALKTQLASAEGEIPTTLVMEEMKEPRMTFVLVRGAYDKPAEAVTAATPAVLPAFDAALPRNRLGLAKWLVGPSNPLTARVTVNRIWQQLFGTGLVRSSEDFGSQGELPSHPELLDWLAVTFRDSGWDVKQLLKLIVTSATYRQQSQLTAALQQRDPDNRLLARGPRHRLLAEFIRDQALAASGLLVTKLGGPSVKPYHPPGLYEQVTAGNGYNVYVEGKGEDLHRRSLYTYWKRSVPHPAMLLFDAPFREICSVRRPRSNTPLQALNLLNDPTYVEAARFLARRMVQEGGQTEDSRLTYGFRLLLARQPRPQELVVLRAAYRRAFTDFETDPQAAKSLLADVAATDAGKPAELAAFTMVASTLLNLDEVVTRE